MWRKLTLVVSLLVLVGLIPGVASAQVPNNDDLEAAVPVMAVPFEDSVATGEATVQTGEPTETCAPFANTVWYAVTLDTDRDVFIDTAGSNYDTTVAVWVGSSFDDIELVACNDDTLAGLQAATLITAEAGVTYLVQVGAFGSAAPDAALVLSIGDPPKDTGRPIIVNQSFRGSFAEAFVEEFDEENGTFAFRGVTLVDGRQQSKGSRPDRFANVFVNSFEETFDETTQAFSFTSWFGFAELEQNEFGIDRRLEDARVTTSVVLQGESCTETPEEFECIDLGERTVQVDVMWDGEGPTTRIRETSAESFEGNRFRFRGTSTTRQASVTGGVAGDGGFDLTGASGNLRNSADGFWQWSRGFGGEFFGLGGAAASLAESGLSTTDVMFDRFRGSFASAFDAQFNEETGQFSFQDVSLMIGRSKTKGDRWVDINNVTVSSFIEQFDEEQGTFTFTEWFGSGPVVDGSIDRRLDSASASATVTLSGFTCTESFGSDGEESEFECTELDETSVVVDVEWQGVGSTSTSRSRFDLMTGTEHLRFSGRSTNRGALANGTVVGDVVGWSYDEANGFLANNADGSWFKG